MTLTLEPIGVVHSPYTERSQAPRQAVLAEGVRGSIELYPGRHFEEALSDIDSWSHLWVVFWFHVNPGWRPMVKPPRGPVRRGVFATRSPHRPNPIGLSAVKLEARRGLILQVSSLDILDGTPVLDLKPYVPYTDLLPAANGGWPELSAPKDYEVVFTPTALDHLTFLNGTGKALSEELSHILRGGPSQPKYRRIRRMAQGYQISIREWRALFVCTEDTVSVVAITSGYPPSELERNSAPELDVHRRFMAFRAASDGDRECSV